MFESNLSYLKSHNVNLKRLITPNKIKIKSLILLRILTFQLFIKIVNQQSIFIKKTEFFTKTVN